MVGAAALLVGALVGCGAGAEEDPEPTAAADAADTTTGTEEDPAATGPEPSEEPAPVTVARAPFCDGVDGTLLRTALGAPSRWLQERRPGDEYQLLLTGEPEKEDDFFCQWQTNTETQQYGPGDATLVATVGGKPVKGAAVAAAFKEHQAFAKALGCEELPLALGDRSYARSCETEKDRYNDPGATVAVFAMYGDSLVTCAVQRSGSYDLDTLVAVHEEVCTAIPEAMGS
jgi:hypothetical protein